MNPVSYSTSLHVMGPHPPKQYAGICKGNHGCAASCSADIQQVHGAGYSSEDAMSALPTFSVNKSSNGVRCEHAQSLMGEEQDLLVPVPGHRED